MLCKGVFLMNVDKLKYLTTKIKGRDEDGAIVTGTGFFVRLNDAVYIVTASHVTENLKEMKLSLRYKVGEHIALIDYPCSEFRLSVPEYDIALITIADMQKEFKKDTGYPMYYGCLTAERILKKEELLNVETLSEVVMVGYPSGITSSIWKYPIVQKGTLASAPCECSENYVNISAVGGSSGSPLLLLGETPQLIGVMSQTVLENPVSSANIGIYTPGYHILDLCKK